MSTEFTNIRTTGWQRRVYLEKPKYTSSKLASLAGFPHFSLNLGKYTSSSERFTFYSFDDDPYFSGKTALNRAEVLTRSQASDLQPVKPVDLLALAAESKRIHMDDRVDRIFATFSSPELLIVLTEYADHRKSRDFKKIPINAETIFPFGIIFVFKDDFAKK